MTLKEIIYHQIIHGQRVASYQFFGEFWYVVKWNKNTFLHYRQVFRQPACTISYFMCDTIMPPKWKAQHEEFKLLTPIEQE